jgi:hypothetical protein
MTELFLHGQRVHTVFSLLGKKENDITYSVGWALAQSEAFLTALLRSVFGSADIGCPQSINLQQHGKDGGYTDITINTDEVQLIIEAKRGWTLPGEAQLRRYAARCKNQDLKSALLVLSECSPNYANEHLWPKGIRNVPVLHRSWKELRDMTRHSLRHGSHAQKRLLEELRNYLEGLMTMQNQTSNEVFLVVQSHNRPNWSKLSWLDFLKKHSVYFHPIRARWPKEPPNYIGFRYDGFLQSIHHVDSYEMVEDVSKRVPDINGKKWREERWGRGKPICKYFIYHLGPPIEPPRPVRNGDIYPTALCWAALDLLLTSRTIAEAIRKTKQRPQE